MKSRPRLAVVPVIAGTNNTSNVIHISGIRSHGPALGGAAIGVWPRRHEWRSLMRRIVKNHGKSGPGEAGGR
jgi:hypothetical protein